MSRGEPSDARHEVTNSGSLEGTGGQPDQGMPLFQAATAILFSRARLALRLDGFLPQDRGRQAVSIQGWLTAASLSSWAL
jgi:hypothetical protein